MTRRDVENAAHLRCDGSGSPATLRLAGDVGPVLRSTCVWAPWRTSDTTGVIRAIDVSAKGWRFGLGAGAFGKPPERAVQRLGEFVLIEGASWWTPAAAPTSSRSEPEGVPILTPFLFRWDHMMSAVATLRSDQPVPLALWYEYLLHRLADLGICRTATIVVEIIADMPARLITDKHLVRAPLHEFRPGDEQLITDAEHLDKYFLRNTAARASGDDTWCTAIMAGVAVEPAGATAAWGPQFVQRGFYTMPGAAASDIMHHTHALVTTQLPAPPTGDRLDDMAGQIGKVTEQWASGARSVQAIHIESNTLLYRADARIGVVGAIALD